MLAIILCLVVISVILPIIPFVIFSKVSCLPINHIWQMHVGFVSTNVSTCLHYAVPWWRSCHYESKTKRQLQISRKMLSSNMHRAVGHFHAFLIRRKLPSITTSSDRSQQFIKFLGSKWLLNVIKIPDQATTSYGTRIDAVLPRHLNKIGCNNFLSYYS